MHILKKTVLFILFFTITTTGLANIDSLRIAMNNSSPEEQAEIMIQIAQLYWAKKNQQKAEQYLFSAMNIVNLNNFSHLESIIYRELADIYYDINKNHKAVNYYKKCIRIQKRINYNRDISYCYNALGALYIRFAKYDLAIENLITALKYSHNEYEKNKIYNNLGVCSKNIGQYKKAIEYFKQSINNIAENDYRLLPNVLNNIGSCYHKLHKDSLSLNYYHKALQFFDKAENLAGKAMIYNNIGNLYMDKHDYNKALEYQNRSLSIKKLSNEKKPVIYPLINIGQIYFKQKKYQSALKNFNEALKLAQATKSPELIKESYKLISQLYEETERFQKSLNYYKKYVAQKDSIFNQQISQQINELQAKYESEKKKEEIAKYRIQSEKNKLLKWRLYLIILIILIIALVIFILYRIKINLAKNLELTVKKRTSDLRKTNRELNNEIQERKKFEKKLQKYEFIVNTSQELMTLINRDFKYVAVNDSYLTTIKREREEIIGLKVADVWGKPQFEKVIKKYMLKCFAGETVQYQSWLNFPGHSKRFYNISYYPFFKENNTITHIVIVNRDITEKKEMETELIKSERLAAFGEIATSLTHEIRNPITVMKSTAQFCKNNYQQISDLKLQKMMNIFCETADRLDKTVTDLMDIASPREKDFNEKNIIPIIEKVLSLTREKCKKHSIKTIFKKGKSIPKLLLNEEQLSGAFLNIVLNSIEAMPEGGLLKISVGKDSRNIMVKISDTGEGIPSENIDNIFKPFFTTKKEGTGLGLPLVQKIMENHNAAINVKSNSEGSVFTIKFKLAKS